jgi:hypothetical protein
MKNSFIVFGGDVYVPIWYNFVNGHVFLWDIAIIKGVSPS